MRKSNTIFLLSSSTGGHAIPLFEIYKEFKKRPNIRPIIIHSASKVESELFPADDSIVMRSGKINRYQPIKHLKEFIKLFGATWKALYMVAIYRPKMVFSKGGFNAVPVLFWSRLFGIPYFLHESDSEMGTANSMFCGRSVKTFVSFPKDLYHQPQEKLFFSGMIVRDFPAAKDQKHFKPMILIVGGSQGAESIDKTIFESLPLLVKDYRVVHHVGFSNLELAQNTKMQLPEDVRESYEFFTYSLSKMAEAMSSADLIISRSGSTIGEIAKLSKASILIPYPYAAADHQMKNAKFLEKVGGAIIIKQDKFSASTLLDRINFILSNPKNAEVLGKNAHRAIKTDGKEEITKELINFLEKK